MTLQQVKDFFGTSTRFYKLTGMAHSNLGHWKKRGGIPFSSQLKLQFLTDGKLIAEENK